ncbi:MOSC domain-containing protein [Rubellimicrobium sp. CFH 75288]|uniref:MOSC domain-containing protein n=1 Tax=Rubellimicrobium sp. CFH 75288 TaxID=2697034 RepID=UPI0014128A30|nr:MOSC domain-containing protein [Rubellimicrobium sp. CFH 75288]NAZ36218.1 MOSC domain-containing protein [Rubellimicrobium sp. CFH 75288]
MPALVATGHVGTILWLGRVVRPVGPDLLIDGEAVDEMPLTFGGFAGEVHAGLTRPACSRVAALYPKGTEIRNTRQLSLVSAEEMAEVAQALGLDRMDYAWVGASVVVGGIPDFTHLPPSSRLQVEGGATLVVDLENGPCLEPARTIDRARPGHGKRFKEVARGRRGITAWVEREGVLRRGDRLRLHVPAQRAWRGTES